MTDKCSKCAHCKRVAKKAVKIVEKANKAMERLIKAFPWLAAVGVDGVGNKLHVTLKPNTGLSDIEASQALPDIFHSSNKQYQIWYHVMGKTAYQTPPSKVPTMVANLNSERAQPKTFQKTADGWLQDIWALDK